MPGNQGLVLAHATGHRRRRSMIEKLHDQLILELKLNERSNTIFVLSSILLNLIILAVNLN
jgi:hypothetical protein